MEFYSASRIRICPANGSRPAFRCVGRRIGLIPGIGKTPFDTKAFSKRRRRLLATGIAPCRMERNASSLTTGQLRKRAWPVTEPRYRARLRIPADAFEEGWPKRLGFKSAGHRGAGGHGVRSRISSGGSGTEGPSTLGPVDKRNPSESPAGSARGGPAEWLRQPIGRNRRDSLRPFVSKLRVPRRCDGAGSGCRPVPPASIPPTLRSSPVPATPGRGTQGRRQTATS